MTVSQIEIEMINRCATSGVIYSHGEAESLCLDQEYLEKILDGLSNRGLIKFTFHSGYTKKYVSNAETIRIQADPSLLNKSETIIIKEYPIIKEKSKHKWLMRNIVPICILIVGIIGLLIQKGCF